MFKEVTMRGLSIIIALIILGFSVYAQDTSGDISVSQSDLTKIVENIERSEKIFPSFEAEMQIMHVKEGEQEENVVEMRLLVGEDKSIAIYNKPAADKGKAILTVGTGYWFYFPKADRSIRISPRSKMFGQALFGDMVKPPLLKYYDYKVVKTYIDEIKQKIAVIEFTTKKGVKGVTFYRKVCYYNLNEDKMVKSESYTKSGFLYATALYSNFKMINNIKVPMTTKIIDPKKPDEHTIMQYNTLKARELADHIFTPAYLPNLKRFK